MTAVFVLSQLLRASRLRVAARVVAFAVPALAACAAMAWRWGGSGWCWGIAAVGIAATILAIGLAIHRIDTRWLAQRLDERDPRMEDSASLLFGDATALPPLQQLQLQRLQQRLEAALPPDLRPAWPTRTLVVSIVISVFTAALALTWPAPSASPEVSPESPSITTKRSAPTHTRIAQQRLDITPPAYTRLPQRHEDDLDLKVTEGASVRWTLRLVPVPVSAALAFHDGRRIPLKREGDDWMTTRRVDAPLLYRILIDGAPPLRPNRLHRIDVTADQPPQIRTLAPEETLTLRRADQRTWTVSFEAQDDYGLGSSAALRITLAQGEGENIQFSERSLSLQGTGTARRRRYSHTFDLTSLGLSPGSDFVVQLSVTDNRAAGPQTTHSASHILRWPPEEVTESSGLDGLVKKALPAYFRSQRQIIIDSEALLEQRRKLASEQYLERSDAIGVDQRLLRLRYGQFLGEETEGAPRALLPTADAEAEAREPPRRLLPTADAEDEAEAHAKGEDRAPSPSGSGSTATLDEHDEHGNRARIAIEPPAFGDPGDVLSEYGHTHDNAEAATLLDPETRRTLKAALDQMWRAELHLRQGQPDLALPYEYKALDYIKQVRQAGRVYLARVGSELPPIDESRRLSGDRKGLAPRDDLLEPAPPTSPLLARLWQALESAPQGVRPRNVKPVDLDAAERWLRANEGKVPDALGVIAAIDGVRNEPDCASCRQLLRSRLWPLLPRPSAQPMRRTQPDRSGQAYLDALQPEKP